MKFIITESQYNLLIESVNRDEILSLVKKSNSFTKEYGMDIENNIDNIKTAEKLIGISLEDIMDNFQVYVDSQSDIITNLMISNGDYKEMAGKLLQKLASILLIEYNKIGNFKKNIVKKLLKDNRDTSKDNFIKHIASELNSYAGGLVEAIFRRLPNWVDDAKSIDSSTKQKYRAWSKNVENYIDQLSYPYWIKIATPIVNELWV